MKWISVEEPPEINTAVIGCDWYHTYDETVFYDGEDWRWVATPEEKVITTTKFWMPLPVPPEEE